MSPNRLSLSSVVLAGGHSRRMGTDKAWLPHPETGQPMLRRQLSLLASCGGEAPVVSARTGQELPALPPDTERIDDDGTTGPLGGIVSALAGTTCDHLLVIAVDLPKLSESEIQRLSGKLESPGLGVYAHSPGGPQPLVSIMPQSLLPELQAALADGQLSLRRLFAGPLQRQMSPVAFPDNEPFQNWNEPGSSEG